MNWSNNPMRPFSREPGPRRFPASFLPPLRSAMAFCLSALLLFPFQAEAKEKKHKKHKEDAKTDIPIPIGHAAQGIRIPSYDATGKLQMYFNIDNAFRLDEVHLKMENLKIETFDETGKSDMLIDMPASMLDLNTRIISSVDPVTIHRADFEVTGSHMTFNTQTQQGSFSGPVRMFIFNNNDLDPSQKETPGE